VGEPVLSLLPDPAAASASINLVHHLASAPTFQAVQPTADFNLSTTSSPCLLNLFYSSHSMTLKRLLLYLWSSPTSLLGLIFLHPTRLTSGRAQIVDGVLDLHPPIPILFHA